MTKVDFFIWPLCKKRAHDIAVCYLIYSYYRKERKLSVLIEDSKERGHMDSLLWSFEETSFIPHGIDSDFPVKLTADFRNTSNEVLVNLGKSCPPEPKNFRVIIETAGYDELTRSNARLKFKRYKESGFIVSSHTLKNSEESRNIVA